MRTFTSPSRTRARHRSPESGSDPPGTLDEVDWSRFDFLDLGCSRGGSIRYCRRRFGARRGLGLDLDPEKVAAARAAGHDAVEADATRIAGVDRVRFVSMVDFLEHLPGLDAVAVALEHAAAIASDFLFIQHPSFEGEGIVEEQGVRQYWWNWTGHKAHPQVADYRRMFAELGLDRYSIAYEGPVWHSDHPSVLPLAAPKNQHEYDRSLHPAKPSIELPAPLWHRQEIVVALRPFSEAEWTKLVKGRLVWRAGHRLRRLTGSSGSRRSSGWRRD